MVSWNQIGLGRGEFLDLEGLLGHIELSYDDIDYCLSSMYTYISLHCTFCDNCFFFFFFVSKKSFIKKRKAPLSAQRVYIGTTQPTYKKTQKNPQQAHNTTSCVPCLSNA
jgi:hypothetical protein